jgi:hypothetical protein
MRYSAGLFCLFAFASLDAFSVDSPVAHIVGHYSDQQLADVRTLILPRLFLYDSKNQLVPDEQWPAELADVMKHKGDGRCCLDVFASIKNTSDYVWITIDMTRVNEIKAALKEANNS